MFTYIYPEMTDQKTKDIAKKCYQLLKTVSKKILLTGASGYIGSSILKFLIKKNYKIFALYFKREKNFINHKNVKYMYCNLDLKNKLKNIFQNHDFDTIINLAALKDYKKKFKRYFK